MRRVCYTFPMLPMWEKQQEALDFAIDRASQKLGVCLFMEMGTGKAIPLDTPMLTPIGWTTMGQVKVGDYLIGKNGKPTQVEGVYPQGEQDLYRLTFSDSTSALSTLDHLWEVSTPLRKWRNMPSMVLSTREMLIRGLKHKNGNRKYFIPIVEPVQFETRKVTLDPYLLGVLLGDGTLRKHSIVLSNSNPDILSLFAAKTKVENVCLKFVRKDSYGLTGIEHCKNSILQKMRTLSLLGVRAKSKFIPDEYLFNSIHVRTEILRGLLDTDGSVDRHSGSTVMEYTTVSPQLAEQVKFLVQSLGGTVVLSKRYPTYTYKGEKKTGQLLYRLRLKLPNTLGNSKTLKKQNAKRTKYHPSRAIESIEPAGKGLCQCIKVSAPDGLFVINDCIVTHNTRVAIHWLEYLIKRKRARLVYVAAPLTVLHVWVENWHKWAKNPVVFLDLHETGSAGLKMAQKLADEGNVVICLVNYEASWQIGYKWIKHTRGDETVRILEKVETSMSDLRWDVGILDESTAIKTPGSKVSKFFRRKMAKKTRYKMVMTGTAYTKRPLDVWAQVTFATGDEVFPSAFLPFKLDYSIPHPTIRGATIGYRNLKDMVKKLAQVAVLLKKKDVLDLPPFVHETREIELSARSRKIYDDLKEDQVAEIEALIEEWDAYKEGQKLLDSLDEDALADVVIPEKPKIVTAMHIFTSIRKLIQITSGFVYPDVDDDEPEVTPAPVVLGKEKLDIVLDILDNRDSPTVIVTQLDQEEVMLAAAIKKKFGYTPKILNGSVKKAEARYKMIASAAEDRAFIVKESVGAKGVDMCFADMIVFFSHTYDTEDYEQMMSRNHRGVQTKNVTYMHILCKNTIDVKIMRSLERDLNLAASIERDWRQLFE